jgi:hypothetical protein
MAGIAADLIEDRSSMFGGRILPRRTDRNGSRSMM